MILDEKQKLYQQDMVDSEIWNLVRNLYPARDDIKYDGNIINKIRLVLMEYYVNEIKVCTEEDFYPYIEEN